MSARRPALEIDHVFVMVDPRGAWAERATAAGWVLDAGIAHEGQGTQNRRLWLPEQYLEFLWVRDRTEAERNPLRLDRRHDWRAAGTCPFGIGLRGRLPEGSRSSFWTYEPPYAPGAQVLVHRANELSAGQPFLFVFDVSAAQIERHLPRNRWREQPELLRHTRADATLLELRLFSAVRPQELLAPLVTWTQAEKPRLEVVIGRSDARLALDPLLTLAG